MFTWITQHEFWVAVALYWIFSAAVSSMPAPASNNSAGYSWIYRFLHTVAGNVTTAFGSRIPGAVLGLVVTIPLLLFASACTPHYMVHPGAVNRTDSAAYDALLIAQAAIDQAKTAYQAGQLPTSAKQPLDALIQSYNIARESWLTYRGVLATNVAPEVYFDELNKNIRDLLKAIQTLREAAASASAIARSHKEKEDQ